MKWSGKKEAIKHSTEYNSIFQKLNINLCIEKELKEYTQNVTVVDPWGGEIIDVFYFILTGSPHFLFICIVKYVLFL